MPSYQERLTANNLKIDEITILANTLPDADEINEKIDTQDTIIANLKSALNSKSGIAGGTPNVFVQTEEPEIKKGIWLKENGTMEHLLSDANIFFSGDWTMDNNLPYDFYNGASAVVGTDIYVFGGAGASPYTQCYKYDTLTGVYTQKTSIPYSFYYGSVVAVGTDIYLLGGNNSLRYNYKYDTLTDTYTQMSNIPYDFYWGAAALSGDSIYLFGGITNKKLAARYDILTDTYTQLANLPYNFYKGAVVTVESGNIFIFGGEGGKRLAAEYDVGSNTYSQLPDIPYDFSSGCAVKHPLYSAVCLIGGTGTASYTQFYQLNYGLMATYDKVSDIPYQFYMGSAVVVGNDIHLLGGSGLDQYRTNGVYHTENKQYDVDNAVIIIPGTTYSTELITTDISEEGYQPTYTFDDVYFYTTQGGLDDSMPVYYGDGTQWINIKNPVV